MIPPTNGKCSVYVPQVWIYALGYILTLNPQQEQQFKLTIFRPFIVA